MDAGVGLGCQWIGPRADDLSEVFGSTCLGGGAGRRLDRDRCREEATEVTHGQKQQHQDRQDQREFDQRLPSGRSARRGRRVESTHFARRVHLSGPRKKDDSTHRELANNLNEGNRVDARQRSISPRLIRGWYRWRLSTNEALLRASARIDASGMEKRLVAAPLWFISVWLTYGLVAYFLGISHQGGAVLGALLAAFVWMDPTGALWGAKDRTAQTASPATNLGAAASTR